MDNNNGIGIEIIISNVINWLLMNGNEYSWINIRCYSWNTTIRRGFTLDMSVAGGYNKRY